MAFSPARNEPKAIDTHAKTTPLFSLAVLLALPACRVSHEAASVAAVAASESDLVARGDYLVHIAGCNDCHTPGYTDRRPLTAIRKTPLVPDGRAAPLALDP